MKPGTYRLLEDFEPLRNDKRKASSDWRYAPIKRGQLFFYTEFTYAPNEDKPEVTITERRLFPVNRYSTTGVVPNESYTTRQLIDCLLEVEETASLWLRREHGMDTALAVIDRLCDEGTLTLAIVQTVAAEYHQSMRTKK